MNSNNNFLNKYNLFFLENEQKNIIIKRFIKVMYNDSIKFYQKKLILIKVIMAGVVLCLVLVVSRCKKEEPVTRIFDKGGQEICKF